MEFIKKKDCLVVDHVCTDKKELKGYVKVNGEFQGYVGLYTGFLDDDNMMIIPNFETAKQFNEIGKKQYNELIDGLRSEALTKIELIKTSEIMGELPEGSYKQEIERIKKQYQKIEV